MLLFARRGTVVARFGPMLHPKLVDVESEKLLYARAHPLIYIAFSLEGCVALSAVRLSICMCKSFVDSAAGRLESLVLCAFVVHLRFICVCCRPVLAARFLGYPDPCCQSRFSLSSYQA